MGTCEFAEELPLASPDLSSSVGREFVVLQKKIAVLSSTAGSGRQARGRLELVAAAASLGLGFLSGISTPAAASHYRHHRAYAMGDLGSPSRGWHRSHRRSGSDETAEARKPEPAKQPSGPLLLAISIGSQRVTVYDNGTPVAVSAVSTGMAGHLTPMGVFSVIQKQRWHHSNLYSNAPMPYMQRITWSGVALHAGVVPGHPASHGCIRLPERFAVRLWGMTKVGARVVITRGEAAPYEITHPRLAGLVKPSEAAFEPGTSNVRSSAAPQVATGAVVVATTGAVAGGAGTAVSRDDSAPSSSEVGASASPQVEGGAALDKPAEAGRPAEPSPVEPAPAPKVEDPLQQHPGPISLFVSRKLGKLFVRKGFAPVFDVPITIARPEEPLGTHVFTASRPANEGVGVRWLAVSLGYDRAASRPEPAKRKARATRDERPVPLTAHALRQAAVDALDRIELPPEALERIGPLVAPGTSLLISDQGLGSETGRDTDFIVVTR
jgi:lipoprotein-anchoring transpeptidase ErfK/SrfK